MNERVTREQLVEASVFAYAQTAIFTTRGYDASDVQLVEEWDYHRRGELDKETIAPGFDFDDPGQQAEIGSDLLRRLYTIEFVVMGTTLTWAKNLSHALKFALQQEQAIPLLDVTQDSNPELDRMEVLGVSSERVHLVDPEPWQRFMYAVTLRIEDVYHAALV